MDNIFDKIDSIFSGYSDDRPIWAQEILEELKEIKSLINSTNKTVKKIDKNYYDFIKNFRKQMRADVNNDIYPKVRYQNRLLGVNFKGYLYDVESNTTLSREEAFSAYEYFYSNKNDLNIYN